MNHFLETPPRLLQKISLAVPNLAPRLNEWNILMPEKSRKNEHDPKDAISNRRSAKRPRLDWFAVENEKNPATPPHGTSICYRFRSLLSRVYCSPPDSVRVRHPHPLYSKW